MKHYSEERIKHMEFIQNVITRMNTNSFQIKSWSVTITVALLALYASNGNARYLLIAIVPTIVFWFLDSYYLQQERKFRGVYNDAAKITDIDNRKHIKLFDMPINNYKGGKYAYLNVLCSHTILTFYLIHVILLLIGWFILSGEGVKLWQRGKCFIVSIMAMTS